MGSYSYTADSSNYSKNVTQNLSVGDTVNLNGTKYSTYAIVFLARTGSSGLTKKAITTTSNGDTLYKIYGSTGGSYSGTLTSPGTYTFEIYKLTTSSRTLGGDVTLVVSGTRSIYFDANGGLNAPATLMVETSEGSTQFIIPSETPTREGYTFVGWSDDSTAIYPSIMPGSQAVLDDSEFTLYAVWNKNPDGGVLNKVKVDGSWKDPAPRVKVAGLWKQVKKAFMKVNGEWKSKSGLAKHNISVNIETSNLPSGTGPKTYTIVQPDSPQAAAGEMVLIHTNAYGGGNWNANAERSDGGEIWEYAHDHNYLYIISSMYGNVGFAFIMPDTDITITITVKYSTGGGGSD